MPSKSAARRRVAKPPRSAAAGLASSDSAVTRTASSSTTSAVLSVSLSTSYNKRSKTRKHATHATKQRDIQLALLSVCWMHDAYIRQPTVSTGCCRLQVDPSALFPLACTRGGLLRNENRTAAWPALLGLHPAKVHAIAGWLTRRSTHMGSINQSINQSIDR